MVERAEKPTGGSERRRSQRVFLSLPVLVRGAASGPPSFEEETRTLVVNAHGALIILANRVEVGEKLRLKNLKSGEERPCEVAYVGPEVLGKIQVGVEFVEAAPQFWHITFPPEDWAQANLPSRA
jgi:hypothetical protein